MFLQLLFALIPFFSPSGETERGLYEQNVRLVIDALAVDSLTKAEGLIQETLRLDPVRKSNAILYQYLGEI